MKNQQTELSLPFSRLTRDETQFLKQIRELKEKLSRSLQSEEKRFPKKVSVSG